jgi:hypothetical protein
VIPVQEHPTMPNADHDPSRLERMLARPPAAGFMTGLIVFVVIPQMLFILGMLWWWKQGGLPTRGVLFIAPGFMPPLLVLVGFAVWRLRKWRLRRRLALARGCVCVRCAYLLNELGPSGTCPECGLPF